VSGHPGDPRQETTFRDFIVGAVNDALLKTFDASTAKAVQFYIDTNILVSNPAAYSDSVLRMFGKAGGGVVVDSIKRSLLQKAGISEDPKKYPSLQDSLNAAAKKFRLV